MTRELDKLRAAFPGTPWRRYAIATGKRVTGAVVGGGATAVRRLVDGYWRADHIPTGLFIPPDCILPAAAKRIALSVEHHAGPDVHVADAETIVRQLPPGFGSFCRYLGACERIEQIIGYEQWLETQAVDRELNRQLGASGAGTEGVRGRGTE